MTALAWIAIAFLLPAFMVLALEPDFVKVAGMAILIFFGG